jgi:hypothetical protein
MALFSSGVAQRVEKKLGGCASYGATKVGCRRMICHIGAVHHHTRPYSSGLWRSFQSAWPSYVGAYGGVFAAQSNLFEVSRNSLWRPRRVF